MFSMIFDITETQLDKNYKPEMKFEKNLPHHDFICKVMEKDWRNSHLAEYFGGSLRDKVKTCSLTVRVLPYRDSVTGNIYGVTSAVVTAELKDGYNLSDYEDELAKQIEFQFRNGWGEDFFGGINILTAPDGIKFWVNCA